MARLTAAESCEWLARAFGEADGLADDAYVVVAIPCESVPTEVVARWGAGEDIIVWSPPEDWSTCARGVVERRAFRGATRFDQLHAFAEEVKSRARIFSHPLVEEYAPAPRIFGGMAFAAVEGVNAGPWAPFGDGWMVLPKLVYYTSQELGGVLQLTAKAADVANLQARMELMGEVESLLETLNAHKNVRQLQRSRIEREVEMTQLPYERWCEYFDAIQGALASGEFQKLVAARRCDCRADSPFDPMDVLLRLADEPGCTRFLFDVDNTQFLGATPERLFKKLGSALVTAAVAGTIRSTGSEFPAQSQQSIRLMASAKNRAEHAHVVHAIADALAPFADEVQRFENPTVIRIRHIIHLNTAITATLKEGVAPASLLAAIHPSPAVGGLPKRGAADWIAAHEPTPRGWYTGPVGWIDINDDAEFVVAIRAGLIQGKNAFVYSGAGIVSDSSAESEYAETQLKQQPILRALGIEPT